MSADLLTEPELRTAIDRTASAYSEAMTVGLRDATMPAEMTRHMQEDIYIFSGFKTYHSLKEASLLLRDEQGLVKPFDRFYKDVTAIDAAYNKNYLQAEYIFATQSARMAAKWADFEQNGDRYDLQYRTAGDDKVREAHAALDLVTLPSTDPFWEEYFPPNGWRCRCNAIQVRKGKYPRSNPTTALAAGQEATSGKLQMFRFNPGRQSCIFPRTHPYYGKTGYRHCLIKNTANLAANIPANEVCRVLAQCYQNLNGSEDSKQEFRQARKEAEKSCKRYFAGKQVQPIGAPSPITITATAIKEYINQPFFDMPEKFRLAGSLDEFIQNSRWLGELIPREGDSRISYISEIQISQRRCFLVFNEFEGTEIMLHSISDADLSRYLQK